MRRIRVTGRFYVFLALVAVGLFFILRELISFDSAEAIVRGGSTTYNKVVDAVVVRTESVTSFEGNGRVEYIAQEGQEVAVGTEVAAVFTASHVEREMENLETIRKNIRSYYRTVFDDIKDAELERLENNVQAQALEFKRLIENKSVGSMTNVVNALEFAMQERQNYLRNNRRDNMKLNDLFNQESTKLNNISSWKSSKKADIGGMVSFYLDGYESALTPEALPELTIADVRNVLAGKPLAQQTRTARLRKNIFKVVSASDWYMLLYTTDTSWNPVQGQQFQMQMEGVNGYVFVGRVMELQKSGEGVLAQLQIDSDLGPMLNRRSGKVDIGVNLTGFTVPVKAIITENGQTGVIVSDAAGGTFVPVQVLLTDADNALVDPLTQGNLIKGQRVRLP